MECHLDSGLEQEIRASLESSEKDKLSDDSTNTDSSGIDAE
jgi:hypothetical protein